MDGWTVNRGKQTSVCFVSKLQALHYGGYAEVARSLATDIILPPSMIEDFHTDLCNDYAEVGHA